MPYTLALVSPTNRTLMRSKARFMKKKAEAVRQQGNVHVVNMNVVGFGVCVAKKTEDMEDLRRLIGKWAVLNYVRAALPAVGALFAWSAW